MLRIDSLTAAYGAVQALTGVSLTVGKGEVVSLLGSNGAGKTTLIRSITGLVIPRSGAITFMDEDITGKSAESIAQRGVACVPEGRRIFPGLSVEDNLLMGTVSRGRIPAEETGRDMENVYGVFPLLLECRKRLGWQLSGGQQQMLAIGRGLMARPKLLLLDEPSLGLAPVLVQEVFRVIGAISKKSGVTILLVEQNARMALSVASRAYVLAAGQVVMEDTAAHLLANREMQKHYLGGAGRED
jgi:branched-chain amino acid transport system ATP-binding protein